MKAIVIRSFGAPSVIDRFTQIEPKALVAVDGYLYNGKAYDRRDVVRDIQAALPSLRATVLIPYLMGQAVERVVEFAQDERKAIGVLHFDRRIAPDHAQAIRKPLSLRNREEA